MSASRTNTGNTFNKVVGKKGAKFHRRHVSYKTRASFLSRNSKKCARLQPSCTTDKETFESLQDKIEAQSANCTGLETQIPNATQTSSQTAIEACDYEVESIVGHRIRIDSGKPEFLLKWKGYPDSENSWEPSSNLDGCTDILYMYIIKKVLSLHQEPILERIFLELLPIKLREKEPRGSKKDKDSTPQRHPKKSTVKVVTKPAMTSKAARNYSTGTPQVESGKKVKSGEKQPLSANKMKPRPASLKQQTSTTTRPVVVTTVGKSMLESAEVSNQSCLAKSGIFNGQLLRDENSKNTRLSNSVMVNHKVSTIKAVNQIQCTSVQCTKEVSDQENADELGIQDSRSHSVESIKECFLHCNGVLIPSAEPVLILKYISPPKYTPPPSPVLHFSPMPSVSCPEDGQKRNHLSHRSLVSPFDDFELRLNISRSPTPVTTEANLFTFNADEVVNHTHSDRNTSFAHSHLISVPDSPVNDAPSTSDDSSTITDHSQSPTSDTMESNATCIPVFLLRKQKLFSTPMPLPRSKSKRSWSQPVPTKAAKKDKTSPSHVPKRLKQQSVPSNIPSNGIINNGLSQSSIINRLTTTNAYHRIPPLELTGLCQSSSKTLATNENDQSPNRLSTPQLRRTQPSRLRFFDPTAIGRPMESAAVLLYRESLLNWQHQLNKQRDGTDEFILVENEVDRATPPFYFKYISSNQYVAGVPNPSDPDVSSSLCGCECYVLGKKCGSKSSLCCPKMANAGFAYSKAGKVQVEPGTPVYECNSKCSCPADCVNRVVQHGRKVPLCIFRTVDGRGWAVKTIQPIKAHTFITEYVGEVITSEEAERRGCYYDQLGSTYLFDLDFDDDNSEFTIDAAREGNISHFFNHSCQPNLVVYSVWIESLDKRLPRIAFFTTRNVSAGEELTFDYQMNHDQNTPSPSSARQKKLRMKCLCRSQKCLGYYW